LLSTTGKANYSIVNSDKERNIFFKSAFMSRLTPEFLGKNYVYGTGEMDVPDRGVTAMDISTPLNHNLRVNTTRI
jgi:hypothetical protein